jgi:modulator of FtsH protease
LPNPTVAYDPSQWSNFFSADAGASAALTGLLFVAASINLPRIIESPFVVSRLAKALSALVGVLFAAILCLVPGQSPRLLGEELVMVALPIWMLITIWERGAARKNQYIGKYIKIVHFALAHGAAVTMLAGGLSLMASRGGGFYWVVAGVMISFTTALLDAWVLLIEILR